MQLQTRLALALVPLIAIPVLALGWLSWTYFGVDLERKSALSLDSSLHLVGQTLADLEQQARRDLELLTIAPETERYARAVDESDRYRLFQTPLLKLFQEYRNVHSEYLVIRFLLPNGKVDARSTAVGAQRVIADPAAEAGLFDGRPHPKHLLIDAAQNVLVLYRRVAVPLHYSESRPGSYRLGGYAALTVSLAGAYARISEVPISREGLILLLDGEGTVVYHHGGAGPDTSEPPGSFAARALALGLSEHDSESLHWGGRRWLVQTRPVAAGFQAVAALPASALTGPLSSLAMKVVALTLVSGLLLAAVLHLALRRLVLMPLARIGAAARAIGAGELNPELAVHSRDEIGHLAEDVREMGRRLDSYRGQIEDLAYNDQLTGLPNWHLARQLLAAQVSRCRESGERLAVLFLDVDRFKQINDNFGHDRGDRLLATFAARLRSELEAEVTSGRAAVARLGGDELLVIVGCLTDDDEAGLLAQRLLAAIAAPFDILSGHYIVTASIGVALFPYDADDAEGLIRCADLAMYRAKAVGRNTYCRFLPELQVNTSEQLMLERRLRRALAERQLRVNYQPIVRLDGLQLASFEALARWRDPELGAIPPDRFVRIAEQSGLIEDLGVWLLEEVCAQLARWKADGLEAVPVAINISPVQLLRASLHDLIDTCLQRFDLTPTLIQLEITESMMIDLSPGNRDRLNSLSRLGIGLHIDDFGTGYSSISYLRRFDIDTIKIDRSFVADVCTNHENRALVTAMIAMAKALGLTVVAEGIETRAQLAQLRAFGCDFGQGYLFARPGTAADAQRQLTDAQQEPGVARIGRPALDEVPGGGPSDVREGSRGGALSGSLAGAQPGRKR